MPLRRWTRCWPTHRRARARDWSAAHAAFLEASTPSWPNGPGIHPAAVMAALARAFPADTIVAERRGQLLGVRAPLLALHAARTQLGADQRGDGVRRPRRGRGGAGRAGPGGAGAGRRRRLPHERPGARDRASGWVWRSPSSSSATASTGRSRCTRPATSGRTAAVTIGDVDVAGLARAYGAAAWCPATLPSWTWRWPRLAPAAGLRSSTSSPTPTCSRRPRPCRPAGRGNIGQYDR